MTSRGKLLQAAADQNLITAAQLARRYGVSVKTINCGPYSWIKRGLPVAAYERAQAGKEARLFDAAAVDRWHKERVLGARPGARRGMRASITVNGRILLSADLVEYLMGRRPDKGMVFAWSAGERAVRLASSASYQPDLAVSMGALPLAQGEVRPVLVDS